MIKAKTPEIKALLVENQSYIERFCNPESLTIDTELEVPTQVMTAVVTGAEIYLPLQGLIDVAAETERLTKELDKLKNEVSRVQGKLKNERFVANAPDEVVVAERAKEQDYLEKYALVEQRIADLASL